jgi:hypothetical protein
MSKIRLIVVYRKLSWLNLSYNKIEYLQGFQDLWGPEYNLAIVQIHGNQIEYEMIYFNLI